MSGQTQPANSTDAPQPTAGRCIQAARGQRANEHATEEHEQDKGEMEGNRGVGEDAEDHNTKDVRTARRADLASVSTDDHREVPALHLVE